jgi:cyclin B
VLGDITNVAPGPNPGSKVIAKPEKLPPVAAAQGAFGAQSIAMAMDMQCQGSGNSDAMVLTPRDRDRCVEDPDLDAGDREDPQQVAEYSRDIYGMMCREEGAFLPRPEYLEEQTDINAKMRAILIDWLVEVHMKYKLKTETLFLAVNLIDRFLEKKAITRKKLQLVGVTGMLIAAKFEEIYPPEVRDFVYITDKAYTKEEILSMEVLMLTVLEFAINCPTVAHFFERYQRINGCSEAHRHLLQYVLELSLPDFKMLRYSPSHLAAAATLLSNKLLKQHPAWPQAMVRHTQQTEMMVKGCAKEMCGLLDAAERSPLQAVRKKFSQPKFHCVGKMTF